MGMRVAIVSHDAIKGEGQGWVVFSLAKGLAEEGLEVHIYANRIEDELLMLRNIHYHYIPVFMHRPRIIKMIIFAVFSSIMLMMRKYDIIHLHGFTAFIKHDVNTSHFVHTSWLKVMGKMEIKGVLYPYHWLYAFLNSIIEKMVYRKAKKVVAVSFKVKQELMECGIPEDKIVVIYNGIDDDYWKRMDVGKDSLKHFGVGDDDFVLLFAGDTKLERKGLRYLIYALRGMDKVKLLIAGNEKRSRFKRLIKELDLVDKAVHIGWINDMRKIYSQVDCFVFPSLYDPCPLVVMEACACGCPVIVSSPEYVGASEIIKDKETGLIIKDPTSSDEIRKRVICLKENAELRKRISENAPLAVLSVKEVVERYLSVYESLLNF